MCKVRHQALGGMQRRKCIELNLRTCHMFTPHITLVKEVVLLSFFSIRKMEIRLLPKV